MKAKSLIFLLLFCFSSLSIPAIALEWIEIGDYSNIDYTCSVIESPPGTIIHAFFGDNNYSCIRETTDGGESWRFTGSLESDVVIRSLAEGSDLVLYAGTSRYYNNYGNVYKRAVGGSWERTTSLSQVNAIYEVLASSDGSIYAGGYYSYSPEPYISYYEAKIFRTTNGGDTWDLFSTFENMNRVYALMETADGAIYAGFMSDNETPIYRTYNQGTSWEPCPLEEEAHTVYDLMEASDGTLYATTNEYDCIYTSTDNGDTWVKTNPPPGEIIKPVLLETSDGTVYVGGSGEMEDVLYYTGDQGVTWGQTGILFNGGSVIKLIEGTDGRIYAATGDSLFVSCDGCSILNTCFANGTINPGNPCQICDTENNTREWTNNPYAGCMQWIPMYDGDGIAYDIIETSNNILFAARSNSEFPIIKSIDGGETWENTAAIPNNRRVEYLVEAQDGSILASVVSSEGLDYYYIGTYRSTDEGDSWVRGPDLVRGNYTNFMTMDSSGGIYLGGYRGSLRQTEIHFSSDAGVTWEAKGTVRDESRAVRMREKENGELFITTDESPNNVFHSTDGGDSWDPLGEIFPHTRHVYDLLISSWGDMYVSTKKYYEAAENIYKSEDNGETWIQMGPVGDSECLTVLLESSNGDIFTGGEPWTSAYVSHDQGETWESTAIEWKGSGPGVNALLETASGDIWLAAYNGWLFKLCDGCLIDGECYEDGTQNSENENEFCIVSVNTSAWTDTTQCCQIDGTYYRNEQTRPDNICEVCDIAISSTSWSPNDGADCTDDLFCNGTDTCLDGTCSAHTGDPCEINMICNEDEDLCEPSTGDDDDDTGDDDTEDDDTGDDDNDAGDDDTTHPSDDDDDDNEGSDSSGDDDDDCG